MAQWKKKTFPKCPKCLKGGGWANHRECAQNGNAWIDVLSGTVKCDGCKHSWSLEKGTNYCSCGAIFKGGEIWKGMALDVKRYGHLVWLKRLGISKGSLETKFVGWQKGHSPATTTGSNIAGTVVKGAALLAFLGYLFSDND